MIKDGDKYKEEGMANFQEEFGWDNLWEDGSDDGGINWNQELIGKKCICS